MAQDYQMELADKDHSASDYGGLKVVRDLVKKTAKLTLSQCLKVGVAMLHQEVKNLMSQFHSVLNEQSIVSTYKMLLKYAPLADKFTDSHV